MIAETYNPQGSRYQKALYSCLIFLGVLVLCGLAYEIRRKRMSGKIGHESKVNIKFLCISFLLCILYAIVSNSLLRYILFFCPLSSTLLFFLTSFTFSHFSLPPFLPPSRASFSLPSFPSISFFSLTILFFHACLAAGLLDCLRSSFPRTFFPVLLFFYSYFYIFIFCLLVILTFFYLIHSFIHSFQFPFPSVLCTIIFLKPQV